MTLKSFSTGTLLALSLAWQSQAASILTQNYARFYPASSPNVSYACVNSNGACSGSAVAPGTNWTVNYSAQGSGSYGSMSDQASVFLTGDSSLGSFPSFESTGARSGFQDTYTVLGGSGSGTLDFIFQVTGSATSSSGAIGSTQFQYVPVIGGQEQFGQAVSFGVSHGVATVAAPIVFGQASTFTIYMYSLAQVVTWANGASATANFSASLSSLALLDSQNTAVSQFSVINSQGMTTYGAAPEPSTLLLFGAALVAAIARRKISTARP